MHYWRNMFGQRSDEFIEGVIAGLKAFAWWKNGVQYIGQQRVDGTGSYLLEEEIKEVKEELK